MDQLIFQLELSPKSSKTFYLKEQLEKQTEVEYCYSRFVPTLIEDCTLKNNRVAFRTFGPATQTFEENGQEGGIISSGIDCWSKKVDY